MGFATRAAMPAIVALALATPAQAAVRPLALADDDSTVALAGGTAVFARYDIDNELVRVLAVPADASARAATRLSLPAAAGNDRVAYLGASAQRVGIVAIAADPETESGYSHEFSGPPNGPWTELEPRVDLESAGPHPALPEVDGANLFTVSTADAQTAQFTLREGDAAPVPLPLPADARLPRFAGEYVAFTDGEENITVDDWRTGIPLHPPVEHPQGVTSLALRADGEVAFGGDDGVKLIDPAGRVTSLSRRGDEPVFAGNRIVYEDGERLMVADPGAPPRPFGVRSATLGNFTADADRVLWEANGCLLTAPIADPAAQAPEPGACPRTEIDLLDIRPVIKRDRKVRIHLRCVAAVGACKGRVRVALHGLTAPARFSIAVGKRATLITKLSPAQLRSARREARFNPDPLTVGVNVVTTDPDGRRHILNSALSGTVR
jgi:hypothetical protein